ncbi:unnamed protein product [Ranitomeya imitator]|uniref:Uncharacterized protein n=1 Tax=Ranitomeya imitator TaxID=111125 RepID=A0ABN9M979_9NEOB|nr:unnamed protein product [Ranitomeya imitator]
MQSCLAHVQYALPNCGQSRKALLRMRRRTMSWKYFAVFRDIERRRMRNAAIKRLTSCLSEGKEFLSQNHMLFGQIMDHLAQAEASRGDWAAAAKHLRKSIQLVSQRYGSSSMELGHELFKLAQILFNGREVDDAMGIILRARDILSVHYGPDNSMVQELQEMRTCLLEVPGMRTVWEK